MTDEQIIDRYNAMVAHYGDLLPDPEHCPKEFYHYVQLFSYFTNTDSGENRANEPEPQGE